MASRKVRQAALIYASILIGIYVFGISYEDYALTDTFSLRRHLLYHHFHANIWHLLCNVWAFLTIAFYWNVTASRLCLAYILASTYPQELFGGNPIVGISGLIYVLVGMSALNPPTTKGKIKYNAYVLLTISAGLVIPMISVGVHAYCYVAGVLVALLNYPFFQFKQKQL